MNKKGGILADVLLILIGFLLGMLFGEQIIKIIEDLLNWNIPLI